MGRHRGLLLLSAATLVWRLRPGVDGSIGRSGVDMPIQSSGHGTQIAGANLKIALEKLPSPGPVQRDLWSVRTLSRAAALARSTLRSGTPCQHARSGPPAWHPDYDRTTEP